MTAKDAKDASRRLRDMEAADELRQKRDAEKNSLESFVFEIRGQVRDNEEDLSKVSPVSFSCFVWSFHTVLNAMNCVCVFFILCYCCRVLLQSDKNTNLNFQMFVCFSILL